MTNLVWNDSFTKALQGKAKSLSVRKSVEHTIRLLTTDPFHHSLHSFRLQKLFEGTWACSPAKNLKIIFELAQHPESGEAEILLLAVGTHDEVY